MWVQAADHVQAVLFDICKIVIVVVVGIKSMSKTQDKLNTDIDIGV